ncbi:MAG: hypothetical protein AAGC79_09205 [Pseudomonadota bacterium]
MARAAQPDKEIKTMWKRTLAALAVAAAITDPAIGKETLIGVSPFGTPEAKLAEVKAIANHLLAVLEPGETGWVVNAYDQSQIAEITISTDPKKSESLQRRMRNAPEFFAGLKRFAEAAIVPTGENFAGQIDLPGFLRNVGANYPADRARDLILYNVSPLTHDPRSPHLSMKDGAVPDDASIAASRAVNVYGARGEEQLLTHYTVHWGANGLGWSQSDVHAYHIQLFLTHSVSKRGGKLVTFATDPATALRNGRAGISRPVTAAAFKPDDQPTMVTFPIGEVTTEVMESIYERALSERVPSRVELTQARDVEIAIRWTCDCDFDLAIQLRGTDAISYRTPETPAGTLHKDFTSSEALELGWETVTLHGPLDLTTALIAINLYRGAPGAEVEIRIAVGAETWGRRYVIGSSADGGSGFAKTMRTGTPANGAWVMVDARALLGGA